MKSKDRRKKAKLWREANIGEMTTKLQGLGYKLAGTSIQHRLEMAEKHLGIIPPARGQPNSRRKHRIALCLMHFRGRALPKEKIETPVEVKEAKSFYETYEWRRARYDALVRHGGRCCACGRTAKDGIKINVDHIKPVKRFWELRLEPSNLQVLCNECNHGKGNRDETDWRAA